MDIITSRQNEAIKTAAALKKPSGRREYGMFLLEGARLCADAALNGIKIVRFYVTEEAAKKYSKEFNILEEKAEKSFFISQSVALKLADTANTQEFFAVCREQNTEVSVSYNGLYVFTDNVQNPDNLGAVARTAEAMGVDGLIVNSGCDIYSPKAQRAAMGSLLRLPVIKVFDAKEFLTELKNNNMKIFASVVGQDVPAVTSADKSGGTVLIIGNEGNGVSDDILNICTHKITIPMKGRAESLNAATAAAVLIWEFTKDR